MKDEYEDGKRDMRIDLKKFTALEIKYKAEVDMEELAYAQDTLRDAPPEKREFWQNHIDFLRGRLSCLD